MGYRTVVMLNNDQTDQWSNDPDLGKKILRGIHHAGKPLQEGELSYQRPDNLDYGKVVECTHADHQTLAVLDMYTGFTPVGHSYWRPNDTEEAAKLRLLQDMADAMGYRLSKKPARRTP